MKRMSQYIDQLVGSEAWRLILLSKRGPKLSHLFFVDDLILFSEALDSQV